MQLIKGWAPLVLQKNRRIDNAKASVRKAESQGEQVVAKMHEFVEIGRGIT